jgi:hypothetical protein
MMVLDVTGEGGSVPAKKKPATEKQLKGEVRKLHAKLERAEAKVDRWKKRARRNEKDATDSRATIKKLRKRLEKASPGPVTDARPTATTSSSETSAPPDETWTVVRLRAEGRSRGLTGLSGKSKAQLLQMLT